MKAFINFHVPSLGEPIELEKVITGPNARKDAEDWCNWFNSLNLGITAHVTAFTIPTTET